VRLEQAAHSRNWHHSAMGWLANRRRNRPGTLRAASRADLDHLVEFARTRDGVEAFLEPRTVVTESTLVLVAATGEWTRRRIDGRTGADAFAKKQRIPLYEVERVGYPDRMRRWTQHRKAEGTR
jgi:hypothetical protein